MKVASPIQMREIDNHAIKIMNIPGIILMENAAFALCNRVTEFVDKNKLDKNILIMAGKGNNGGDAFALARHLFNNAFNISVYILCKREDIKDDAKINFNIIENIGISIIEVLNNNQDKFKESIIRTDLIIDGIFGTGLKGEIGENIQNIINIANISKKPIISIDIPSGVDGKTGKLCGETIKADLTITFGLPKTGLIIYPGSKYVGMLIIEDIGLPKESINSQDIKTFQLDYKIVKDILKSRDSESNKGDFGKDLLITGSDEMTGAGCLSGEAAYRAGAGLLYLGIPSENKQIYGIYLPEAILLPLKTSESGAISKEALVRIFEIIKDKDAIGIGPGMSWNNDTKKITEAIIKKSNVPLVIDADAINVISENPNILKEKKSMIILTPHPGEMARLIKKPINEVQENRVEVASKFAIDYEVILILKGAGSVIALPDGRVFINNNGNPGMATGGSGDVLTGIILGLLGQGISSENSAILGTYIHGMAGDMAAKKLGMNSLMARDIVHEISGIMKGLQSETIS